MKGDFSNLAFDPTSNFTGVLHQQGRVLLDQDWNAAEQIASHLRTTLGKDTIGANVVAAPTTARDSFLVTKAVSDGSTVQLTVEPGRVWMDGVQLDVPAFPSATVEANYFGSPLQDPNDDASTIAAGVRDAVILELWEDTFSAFQDPSTLIEPALGGPDTTMRIKLAYALRLLRLDEDDECGNLAERLAVNFAAKGHLKATLQPTTTIAGDCPVQAGGGYTGFEHYLYRVEIAAPSAANEARCKWSRFGGGLVGRGSINTAGDRITIVANDQMINRCGLTDFYLEALQESSDGGRWEVVFTAKASLVADGQLALTDVVGDVPGRTTWPADADGSAFFRLWDGIELIQDFQTGVPAEQRELELGIRLEFDPPTAGNQNYQPGDYWTFPVRAAGVEWEPLTALVDGPPEGIQYHRAPLAILKWTSGPSNTITFDAGDIHDCRHVFQPLSATTGCCTFTVGDGVHSHGDFNSLAQALQHLPSDSGRICLLPGQHQANVTLKNRRHIRITGCGVHTIVHPQPTHAAEPIFSLDSCQGIRLDNMTLTTATGTAIEVIDSAEAEEASKDIRIEDNHMIACVHAIDIRVRNELAGNNAVRIVHNEIGMLDKPEGRAAIFSSADEVLIERNRIVVVPAPNPDDPNDPRELPPPPDDVFGPCTDYERYYRRRRSVSDLVEATLLYLTTATTFQPVAYAAQGGVQIAGGSERVKIIGNQIIGGNGNGVTLGHLPPGTGGNVSFDRQLFLPALTEELLAYMQENFLGYLYEIVIAENTIRDMGLSGIGVAAFINSELIGLLIHVEDLTIYRNTITRCAQQAPEEKPIEMINEVAFGGVTLAACEQVVIQENRIEHNGRSQREPVCGVMILYGEKIDISNNRILDNGPRTRANDADLRPGLRGGIVITMGFGQLQHQIIGDQELLLPDGVPAIKIHGNIVTQPLGQALFLMAFGPVSVLDNHLTSQGVDFRVNPFSLVAGAVFVLNLGVSKDLMAAMLLASFRNLPAANPTTFERAIPTTVGGGALLAVGQRLLYLPSGAVLFANNQVTLDLRNPEVNFAFSSQLIASLDDVAYNSNQSECASLIDFLFTDVAMYGVTIRSNDNRFQEGLTVTLNSLFSFGFMNTATTNQASHCLQVHASPALKVEAGNIELYKVGCAEKTRKIAVYLGVPQQTTA